MIGQIAMVLLIAAAASAADGWQPSVRPDKGSQQWKFVGCRDDGIWGSWIGNLSLMTCDYRRSSEQGPIVRSEFYSETGEFQAASEILEKTGQCFSVQFFDDGRSYFRLDMTESTLAVVIEGREVACYTSASGTFIVCDDQVDVPIDATLIAGEPFPAVERGRRLNRTRADHR
jgi:hypothetical protein